MRNCFIILVWRCSWCRSCTVTGGFYQGLKDLKVYAESQVIEQMARVAALLWAWCAVVYVLHLPRIFAIYMAVLSTSIGALMCDSVLCPL